MLHRSASQALRSHAPERSLHAATLTLLLVVAIFGTPSSSARANGVPVRVPLTYLSGLSNWGPTDARGEAELSFAEAAVRLDVKGLPALTNEQYQLWLVKSGTNKAFSLGVFNAGSGGVTGYTGKFAAIDGYDYDLLQITVEPLPDKDPAPADKRSIGGFFAPLKKTETSAAGFSGDTQPAALPNTGDAAAPKPAGHQHSTLGLTLIFLGAVLVIITVRRKKASA